MEIIDQAIHGLTNYTIFFENRMLRRNIIILQDYNAHNMAIDINAFIKERFDPEVKWYDDKSIRYKNFTFLFNIITIVLGAMTPILAATDQKVATIICGVVVAISIGLLKFCKFEELWFSYRTTCETLKKEGNFFRFRADVYADAKNPEQLFIERIESLISRENTQWLCTVKPAQKKDAEKPD